MKALAALAALVAAFIGLFMFLNVGWERPPMQSVQGGTRGLGMVSTVNPRTVKAEELPEPIPAVPAAGPAARTVFKNVPTLGHLSVGEFTRAMTAITAWVAPKEGCSYCHAAGDLAADSVYTKVVARKMIEMTQQINAGWKSHVAETGVTCFTCHRGEPVPANTAFTVPEPVRARGPAGNRDGQNVPSALVGLTSLPYDPVSGYLRSGDQSAAIRVVAGAPLPQGQGATIQATEGTYALMMHISGALGVNCTYCHNSRSFTDWKESTPARATAWHGIRMVQELNAKHLEPLAGQFPPEKRGPMGDGPRVSCATCHQGNAKPLGGVALAKDHPELASAKKP